MKAELDTKVIPHPLGEIYETTLTFRQSNILSPGSELSGKATKDLVASQLARIEIQLFGPAREHLARLLTLISGDGERLSSEVLETSQKLQEMLNLHIETENPGDILPGASEPNVNTNE